jgi:hypothetical protein
LEDLLEQAALETNIVPQLSGELVTIPENCGRTASQRRWCCIHVLPTCFDASQEQRQRELVENARIHIRMEPRENAPPDYPGFNVYLARHYLGLRQAHQLPLLNAFESSFINFGDFQTAAAEKAADIAFQRDCHRAKLEQDLRDMQAPGSFEEEEQLEEDEMEEDEDIAWRIVDANQSQTEKSGIFAKPYVRGPVL